MLGKKDIFYSSSRTVHYCKRALLWFVFAVSRNRIFTSGGQRASLIVHFTRASLIFADELYCDDGVRSVVEHMQH